MSITHLVLQDQIEELNAFAHHVMMITHQCVEMMEDHMPLNVT